MLTSLAAFNGQTMTFGQARLVAGILRPARGGNLFLVVAVIIHGKILTPGGTIAEKDSIFGAN